MSNPPAGWYPDPTGQPDTIRWWNGTQWTSRTEPATAGDAMPSPVEEPTADGWWPQENGPRLSAVATAGGSGVESSPADGTGGGGAEVGADGLTPFERARATWNAPEIAPAPPEHWTQQEPAPESVEPTPEVPEPIADPAPNGWKLRLADAPDAESGTTDAAAAAGSTAEAGGGAAAGTTGVAAGAWGSSGDWGADDADDLQAGVSAAGGWGREAEPGVQPEVGESTPGWGVEPEPAVQPAGTGWGAAEGSAEPGWSDVSWTKPPAADETTEIPAAAGTEQPTQVQSGWGVDPDLAAGPSQQSWGVAATGESETPQPSTWGTQPAAASDKQTTPAMWGAQAEGGPWAGETAWGAQTTGAEDQKQSEWGATPQTEGGPWGGTAQTEGGPWGGTAQTEGGPWGGAAQTTNWGATQATADGSTGPAVAGGWGDGPAKTGGPVQKAPSGGRGPSGAKVPLLVGGGIALVMLIIAAVFLITNSGDKKQADPGPQPPVTSQPTSTVKPGESKNPKLHEGERIASTAISFPRQTGSWSDRKRLVPQLLDSSGQYVLLQQKFDGTNNWYANIFVGALGNQAGYGGDPKKTALALAKDVPASLYGVKVSRKPGLNGAVKRSDKSGWFVQQTITAQSPKLNSRVLTLTVAVFDLGDGTAVAYISDIPTNRPDLKKAEAQAYKGITVG